MSKIMTMRDAARLIGDGDMVTTSGFVGSGAPDGMLKAVAERFADEGHPRGIGLLFAAGQGDGKGRGLDYLARPGLVAQGIGGHWGLAPRLGAMALRGEVAGWNFPQGVISHLIRDTAAGKPGTITHVGLETFVDPRLEGGRISPAARAERVALITVAGAERLFFPAIPIDVALLRGSTADTDGNITMEREAMTLDNLAQAMAARNSGGIVIVQVDRVVAAHSLCARDVVIPAALVDAVVVAPSELHPQTYGTLFNPFYTGRIRAPAPAQAARPGPLDARKVIARRAAFELPMGGIVNLGIGMPEGVARVAAEEGLTDHVTLTAESGVIGGQPQGGLDFGAAINVQAIIAQNQQFDLYDGGGVDLAVLGMAEADAHGNVNVSRYGGRLSGAGGFINISQNARRVVFAGTFTAGGLDVHIGDGRLRIDGEGRAQKFMAHVAQVTFSGPHARRQGRSVLFVTERAVFALTPEGVVLREIAPGVDLARDIAAAMGFAPQGQPRLMDARIFDPAPMGLARDLLTPAMADRVRGTPPRVTLAGLVLEDAAALIAHLPRGQGATLDYSRAEAPDAQAARRFDAALAAHCGALRRVAAGPMDRRRFGAMLGVAVSAP